MKYEFCPECRWFSENLPHICFACDQGDQFEEARMQEPAIAGESMDSFFPIWMVNSK